MTKERFRKFLPVIVLFVLVNALAISGRKLLERWGMDGDVVIIGNLVLFAVTLLSFVVSLRGLDDPNPHAFVRSITGSMVLKLFLFAIAAFVYISAAGNQLSKPALFCCMGLYLLYTFLEVSLLTKMLRGRSNG